MDSDSDSDLGLDLDLDLRKKTSLVVGNGVPAVLGDEASLEAVEGFDDDFGHKASLMVGMVDARCGLVEV